METLKRWNWPLDDWPNFRFDAKRLAGLEEKFLKAAGVFLGSFKHLANESKVPTPFHWVRRQTIRQRS